MVQYLFSPASSYPEPSMLQRVAKKLRLDGLMRPIAAQQERSEPSAHTPPSWPGTRTRPPPTGAASKQPPGAIIETDIAARLDRLPWGRFHTLVVAALGITWILDGLEVTLAGALSGILKESTTLGLSNSQIGRAGSAYLGGAVLGALFFGWLTDRLGLKKLFFIT